MTHRITIIPSVILLLLSTTSCSKAVLHRYGDLPPVGKDASYLSERTKLIAMGDKPVAFPKDRFCEDGDDRCAAFPELETCAMDGPSPCLFKWKDGNGNPFNVETIGEYVRTLKVVGIHHNDSAGNPTDK